MPIPRSSEAAKWWRLIAFGLPFSLLVTSTHAQEATQAPEPRQAQQPTQAEETTQEQVPGQAPAAAAVWESGEEVYEKVCGHCHSPEVGVGTVLAGRELPAIYVQAIVRSGLNAMPAFPASFVDDEALALVAEYLGTLPAPAEQP